jgi:trimeric autotransporter adhesin
MIIWAIFSRPGLLFRLSVIGVISVCACQIRPSLDDLNIVAKDLTPPQIVSISPANGASEVSDKPVITFVFNEEMDASTLNSSTITVKTSGGDSAVGSYAYDEAQKSLTFTTLQNLLTNASYTISATSGIKDKAGNAFAGATSSFSTDVCPKAKNGNAVVSGGTVSAIAKLGCILYLGGTFSAVGTAYSYGVPLDVVTGVPNPNFQYKFINGRVRVAIPDGSGGWYLGGEFTKIGDFTRNRLAHISATGEVLPWNPNASSYVYTMQKIGTTIYIGGWFTSIGGIKRNRLAAVDTSGTLTAWNPDSNDIVWKIVPSGLTTLYVGGNFTTIGGTTRNRLAAIDTSGTLLNWNPNADNGVLDMVINGSTIYIAGAFTNIGGGARNLLAAVSTAGVLQAWDPNPNQVVSTLALSNSTLYVGGDFTSIASTARVRLAAFNTATPTNPSLMAWDPGANWSVFKIAVNNSKIYVGGNFTTIGGIAGKNLVAIDTSGNVLSWNPNMDNFVSEIAFQSSSMYLGGPFFSTGGVTRNRLAAIDTAGALQAWNPDADNNVSELAVNVVNDVATIYAGGGFTKIGGVTRNKLAAIDAAGTLQSWNPNPDNAVSALAVSGSGTGAILYVGGAFTTIAGQPRNRLAAFNSAGDLQAWNPDANSNVYGLTISGTTIYVGGAFTTIGGATRNRAAAISSSGTGAVQSWNPNVGTTGDFVSRITIGGTNIYMGGQFNTVGGISRNYAAAVDANGVLQAWDPNPGSNVYDIAIVASNIYVVGLFTTIAGTSTKYFAILNGNGGLVQSNLVANAQVYSLLASGSTVYLGGNHNTIAGNVSPSISSINTDGSMNW